MSEVLNGFTCDHISEGDSCGLVVTLVEQNSKLRELLSESFLLMHHGGLTTGASGRCMELFMDAQTLGIEIPFIHELGLEVDE